MARITNGITMNGPMPTMSIMFSAVASLRPRPRSSFSGAFIEMRRAHCREDGKGSKHLHFAPEKSSREQRRDKRIFLESRLRSKLVALNSSGRRAARDFKNWKDGFRAASVAGGFFLLEGVIRGTDEWA